MADFVHQVFEAEFGFESGFELDFGFAGFKPVVAPPYFALEAEAPLS